MQEQWKDVPGFEGIYQISNMGRLKSFKADKNGKVLKQTNKKGMYFSIVLTSKENKVSTRIHRLVAEAFIPNPSHYPEVNHINGNKQDNRVENLEWCTRSQKAIHSIKKLHPHQCDAMNNYNKYVKPKTIYQFSLDGEFIESYRNAKEASLKTGVCSRNISQVASKDEYREGKRRHTAGGYIWTYDKELDVGRWYDECCF